MRGGVGVAGVVVLIVAGVCSGEVTRTVTNELGVDADFRCDGVDDQVQINEALATPHPGETLVVRLLGSSHPYVLGLGIALGDDTVLEGEGVEETEMRLADFANWTEMGYALVTSTGTARTTMRRLRMNGNSMNGRQNHSAGDGWLALTMWHKVSECQFTDLLIEYGNDDGLELREAKDCEIHNVTIRHMGHSAISIGLTKNVRIHDNRLHDLGNSGVRFESCEFTEIWDNVMSGLNDAGVQMAQDNWGTLKHNFVHDNDISNGAYGVACTFCKNNSNTDNNTVSHNLMRRLGFDGVKFQGTNNTRIFSNTIVDVYLTHDYKTDNVGNGVLLTDWIYDQWYKIAFPENAQVFDNVIMQCEGYAVSGPATVHHNGVWNVTKGTYSNVTSTGGGDVVADPMFGLGWHLRSKYGRWDESLSSWVLDNVTSPMIDAGDPTSPFGSEPQPNGGRINLGHKGNRPHASKSPPVSVASSSISHSTGTASTLAPRGWFSLLLAIAVTFAAFGNTCR